MPSDVANLIERLKAIPAETKLTLILADIFGSPFDYKATTTGQVKQHGFYTLGGGWSLYGHKERADTPCYIIVVKPYRKHGRIPLKIGQKVIDFRFGW